MNEKKEDSIIQNNIEIDTRPPPIECKIKPETV
jgi:hypothetical protein